MSERVTTSKEPELPAVAAWDDVLAFAVNEDEPDDRCFAVRWQVQEDARDPVRLVPLRRAAGGLLRSAVRLAATELVPSAANDGFLRVAGEGLLSTGDDPGIARFVIVDLAVEALVRTRDPERMTRLVQVLSGLVAGSSPGRGLRGDLLQRVFDAVSFLDRVAPELAHALRAIPAVPPKGSVDERVADLEATRSALLALRPPVASAIPVVGEDTAGPSAARDETKVRGGESTDGVQATHGEGVRDDAVAAPRGGARGDAAPPQASTPPLFVMTRDPTGARILINGKALPMAVGHVTTGLTYRTCVVLALVIQAHHAARLPALEPERWHYTRRARSQGPTNRPADKTELKSALEGIDPRLTIAESGDRLTLPVYLDTSLIALARQLFRQLAAQDLAVAAVPTAP